MLPIFIGYDSREDEAYQVCKHSIERHASVPVEIMPMKHRELRRMGLFTRPWWVDGQTGQYYDERDGKPFSTEFAHSRFLVPSFAKALYYGAPWALFIDCDFLFLDDVAKLFELADPTKAVMVCQHEYKIAREGVKMDGVQQTAYPRKNWSSLILWNLNDPTHLLLTPDAVNYSPGAYLHRFGWLPDSHIGSLPLEWNWIEQVVPQHLWAKAVHYSEGGPWFDHHQHVRYADEWRQERDLLRRDTWKAQP